MATRKPLVMVGSSISELPAADTLPPTLTWSYLVMQRSADPVAAGRATAPVPGDVLAITLGGVTRYRLVPDSGAPTQDAFYSAFSAGVCSGLIAARG